MKLLLLCLLSIQIVSCSAASGGSPPVPPTGTSTAAPTATFAPPPTATADPRWRRIRRGLERRDIEVVVEDRPVDHLFLLRIDPRSFRFVIAYDQRQLKTLDEWQRQTDAVAVFNGGYFRIVGDRYLPDGLMIVDGQPYGQTYTGFGGMLAVSTDGAELRWLVERPFRPEDRLSFAMQSFPILVKPGGHIGFPAELEDHRPARRTVLGVDRAGRFLVLATLSEYFTLHQLSDFLVNSDLDLDVALNLDGGPSSGILLAQPRETIAANSALPFVIAVLPR